ncbi:MAG: type III secretion system export apparatus subunit SctS [Arenicella sp.]
MESSELLYLTSQALILVLMLSMPVVAVGALVGLLVGLFQGLTQIQDQTISFALRLTASVVVLLLTARWLGVELLNFAVNQFEKISHMAF